MSCSSSSLSNLHNLDGSMSENDNGKKREVLNANSNGSGEKSRYKSRIKEEEEEEEGGSCGICIFMKAGGCKKEFTSWERCVKGVENEDDLNKCIEMYTAMKKCMDANPSYYKPLLDAMGIASMGNWNEQNVDQD